MFDSVWRGRDLRLQVNTGHHDRTSSSQAAGTPVLETVNSWMRSGRAALWGLAAVVKQGGGCRAAAQIHLRPEKSEPAPRVPEVYSSQVSEPHITCVRGSVFGKQLLKGWTPPNGPQTETHWVRFCFSSFCLFGSFIFILFVRHFLNSVWICPLQVQVPPRPPGPPSPSPHARRQKVTHSLRFCRICTDTVDVFTLVQCYLWICLWVTCGPMSLRLAPLLCSTQIFMRPQLVLWVFSWSVSVWIIVTPTKMTSYRYKQWPSFRWGDFRIKKFLLPLN